MERGFFTLEVRYQDFDACGRRSPADFTDGVGEDRRATILHVVSIHRGNHDVPEIQLFDCGGHASGFRGIDGTRAPVSYSAVTTRACADVAENHERGRPVRPAFADVRAAGLLADRVEVQVPHQTLEPEIRRRPGCFHFEPLRLWLSPWRERIRRWWNRTERDYRRHAGPILVDQGLPRKCRDSLRICPYSPPVFRLTSCRNG